MGKRPSLIVPTTTRTPILETPVPEPDTARSQFERILYLLPLAAREGGASLEEASRALGVPVARIVRDLEEVLARVYYHPTGGADDLQLAIEHDRIRLWTTGEFKRPIRLTPRESLALALGLRVLAAEKPGRRRAALIELAEQLDHQLTTAPAEAFLAHYALEGEALPDGAHLCDGEAIRGVILDASRANRRCRINYLKPEAREPASRTVDPYAIVYANGFWYVIGAADEGETIRVFRLDRILAVAELEHSFAVPDDFDATEYMTGGRVFRGNGGTAVVVRYSASIGRWILERGDGIEQADGSVVVEHRASDPRWAVRHVLQYGAEAEILEPPALRGLTARTALSVAEAHAEDLPDALT
jgi:proteasome accessory factor C